MNSSMLIILLIIFLMYFMMIRPQQKAQKKQKEMLQNIKPGMEVVTMGGLHATVNSVSADHKTVSLDADGSFLTYELAAIRTVVPKNTESTTPDVSDDTDDVASTDTTDENSVENDNKNDK